MTLNLSLTSTQTTYLPNFCGTAKNISSIYSEVYACPYLEYFPLTFPLNPFFSDPEQLNNESIQVKTAREIDAFSTIFQTIFYPRQTIASTFDPRGSIVKRFFSYYYERDKYSNYSKDCRIFFSKRNIFVGLSNLISLVSAEFLRVFDFAVNVHQPFYFLTSATNLFFMKFKDDISLKEGGEWSLNIFINYLSQKPKKISWLSGQILTNFFAQKIWADIRNIDGSNPSRSNAILCRVVPLYFLSLISEAFSVVLNYERALAYLKVNNKNLEAIRHRKFSEKTLEKGLSSIK